MPTQVLGSLSERRTTFIPRASTRLLEQIAACWNGSSLAGVRSSVVFWLLLVTFCSVRAFVGMYGMRAYCHDGFMVLDGAWRMANGQRPHLDFNSMIGPVAYLPTVLAFPLCHGSAVALGYGQVLVALVLGMWAWFLGKANLLPMPRCVYALSIAALAGSPALVGASPFDLSPGMTYNRLTYALLGLVLLECVRSWQEAEFAGGFSSGAVLGLVAFLKMTGVFIEIFLLVSLLPMRKQSRQRWLGFLCGVVLVSLPLLVYMHFQVGLIWADLRITAGAKHMVFYDRFDFGSIFLEAAFALLFALVGTQLLRSTAESARMLWAFAIVVLASLALLLSNFQRATLPLLTLLLIVLIDRILRSSRETAPGLRNLRDVAVAGSSIHIAVLGLSLAASLIAGAFLRLFAVPHRPHFNTPALHNFVVVGDEIPYTEWVNDGLTLLAAHRQPGEHVMSLDFTNPFTFGLHLAPAAGGTSNLQYRGSFDDNHKLTPERLFGASELVMVPKVFSDPTLFRNLLRIYGPYLEGHYQLVGQSPSWKLYRRLP